ncbi:MAG TPA: hypothetical protein VH591_23335 [Ktedonobacterales bacterium]
MSGGARRKEAQEGTLTTPGDASALLSLIRVEDMARAVALAAEAAPAGAIYNVVDDLQCGGRCTGELSGAVQLCGRTEDAA